MCLRGEHVWRRDDRIKYLVFPHKFFMVYATARPARLLGMWGGEPGEQLQAFRVE